MAVARLSRALRAHAWSGDQARLEEERLLIGTIIALSWPRLRIRAGLGTFQFEDGFPALTCKDRVTRAAQASGGQRNEWLPAGAEDEKSREEGDLESEVRKCRDGRVHAVVADLRQAHGSRRVERRVPLRCRSGRARPPRRPPRW